ncbi:hypothetical protein C2E21_8880 [Chlorella sorokiniana]|uniref:Uncharacterized protein n=1 Tax=Chlorella sorokiniana TaxID=3076 RepID=A0A2P6TD86_CHLSO|nr:hypothetical protein C2E21_8880 [Chlorella sorokiniana]|eukprot:PRW20608.1 hypothetical protein C2E21_8880 [Chlorella sorokiniana]
MLASLGQLALLIMLWPILLGLQLFELAEHGAAVALGAYFGLLQARAGCGRGSNCGGAFAAAAIAHLLLSRGGLTRLVWGAGAHRLAARAMSVPVPGTPPRRTDALRAADRLPSDALPAIGAIGPVAAQPAGPAEPAVPQPITPPPVATAGSLPSESTPLLAPVAEEAEAESSSSAAAAAAAATQAAPATPAQPAPQQAAPQPSPPAQPPAHPVLDAALAREEQLLAAFEPAGPEALQAAAAWLQATEPSPSMGGNGLHLPAEYTATEPQAGAGDRGPAAQGYQPLPQRPPEEAGKQAPAGAEPAGPEDKAPAAAAAAASPARPPRPLASAGSGRMSVASRGSGRSGSALSFDRMASHPLADLELDEEEGGSRLAGAAGSTGPAFSAGPFASAPAGALDSRTAGGLQAAAAEAATHAVHAAVAEAALPGAAGLQALPLGGEPAFSGGEMDAAELTADDSMDITRHTKREKR